ncbi:translation initiation factor IF-2 [Elephas maximus indicus]|uniref:translation initiation factor IF-2 n=1 Tax=Elephas maximus indicus TaxID=99487 RepID=UPI002115EA5A|nr:translation initiation factor IF-2 [Elephas maximus indicus]
MDSYLNITILKKNEAERKGNGDSGLLGILLEEKNALLVFRTRNYQTTARGLRRRLRQTLRQQSSQKSKFRSFSARPRRGHRYPRSALPRPASPSRSSTQPCQTPARLPAPGLQPQEARPAAGGCRGPTLGGPHRGRPPCPRHCRRDRARIGGAGSQPGPASSRDPRDRQKDRQPATKRGTRSPCILSLDQRERVGGLFTRRLGAPLRSGSLGPASGQTDRRTMGPGPQLGPDRVAPLRYRAPAGGGRLWAEPVAGNRGAALQTDKATGRQTDGGGKDGDAGGGSALLAHPQPVGRVHERSSPSLPPFCSSLVPLPASLERAWCVGGA